jgi:sugar phosphate isomerase/epimerase
MGAPIKRGEGYRPFIEANIRCIEACAKLGIDCVVIHTGYDEGLTKEECFARNKEFFDELIPTAEKCGVYILIENFNKMCIPGLYWIDNATDLAALCDLIGSPWVKCCYDIGHANLQDMPQKEELKILGHRVHALHVQDNCGDDDFHLAPFLGTTNYDDVMTGLIEIGFKGYFTFESEGIFSNPARRRPFDGEDRLKKAPLSLRIKAEELIYEIGKTILSAYDMYEE